METKEAHPFFLMQKELLPHLAVYKQHIAVQRNTDSLSDNEHCVDEVIF